MKKSVFLLCSLCLLAVGLYAQDSSNPSAKHHHAITRKSDMMQQLNLTAEQQAKLKAMREADRAKVEAIQQNEALSSEEKMQQVRSIRQSQRQALEDLLTPEQKSKMKAMRADQMHDRKLRRPHTSADNK